MSTTSRLRVPVRAIGTKAAVRFYARFANLGKVSQDEMARYSRAHPLHGLPTDGKMSSACYAGVSLQRNSNERLLQDQHSAGTYTKLLDFMGKVSSFFCCGGSL